jgi:predicted negative regulator of RcsB-dependent stress response
MNKQIKQAGFSAVEFILVIAVLGLLGFIGWRVYDANKPVENDTTQTEVSDEPIEKAEDLEAEADALNNQNIDEELDTSEIDAALE